MKNIFFFASLIVFISLTACNTIYKSGQTPDDLYAATPKVKALVNEKYEQPEDLHEDRQIRMAVYDYRWRNLDYTYDYNYNYNPYNYGYSYGYYYNPFYYSYPVYSPGIKFINPKNTTVRMVNLGGYQYTAPQTYTKTNPQSLPTRSTRYNNSNYETRSGSTETRTYTEPARSQTSNSNNSNSNSSSTPAPGSTGRPARGN